MSKTHIDLTLALRWTSIDRLKGVNQVIAVLDGFRLIESLVLAEQPVIEYARPYGAVLKRDPLIGPFVDAGVLELRHNPKLTLGISEGPQAESEDLRDAMRSLMAYGCGLRSVVDQNVAHVPSIAGFWQITHDYIATFLGGDPHKPIEQDARAMREGLARINALQAAGRSIAAFGESYNSVSVAAEADILELKRQGRPIPIIIPPIAASVLSAAARRDAIGNCAMDVRADMEKARRAFAEHERRITDDDLSIGESVDASRALQSALDTVLHKDPERSLITVSEWSQVARDVGAGFAKGGTLGAAGALLGKPMKVLDEEARRPRRPPQTPPPVAGSNSPTHQTTGPVERRS